MEIELQLNGLWVPLITPFFRGRFDGESLARLVREVEPFVDGFVPCLSSGEGGKMTDDLWEEVVKVVLGSTKKPVAVGILSKSLEKIIDLSARAKALGCVALAVPLQGEDPEVQKSFCKELSDNSSLPVILYNTEKIHIDTADVLVAVAQNANIIALKDSSQNQEFFQEIIKFKQEGKISLSIFQGMENQLLGSNGCDGYLLSLANVEPKLCRDMFTSPTKELNDEVMKKWDELDLASATWYVGIKQVLFSRGVIKSAELITI